MHQDKHHLATFKTMIELQVTTTFPSKQKRMGMQRN